MIPELAVAARWLHLAASIGVVGACVFLVLAGRSDRRTVMRWQARVLGGARVLVVVAIVAGVVTLGLQAALLEKRAAAALDPSALARLALGTEAGAVWLVRHGLLLLLAGFTILGPRESTPRASEDRSTARAEPRAPETGHPRPDPISRSDTTDWLAARAQTAVLGLAALGLLAASGHAAAVEPGTARAIAVDGMHLLASGVWIGGLLPLALLLRAASGEEGADARPYAVVAARRFSRCALLAVVALALTGIVNATTHIADVAGLVGTPYGRLLLLKLALVVALVAIAAASRRVLPRLRGDGVQVGRPAMRRLARLVTVELAGTLAILVVVAMMAGTPPARHEPAAWPFPWRLSFVTLADAPALRARVLVGSQVAVLGAVAILCAFALRRRVRVPVLAGAIVLLGFGGGLALPPLAIDAYPTTYLRPATPYTATSIAAGAALYDRHCVACHGPSGAGDGPAAAGLPRPPADLRAPHTLHHTAGDLFWWVSRGIPHAGMPGFAGTLDEEQRWDLINFVRALAAAREARRLGPVVEPERPRLVAPDATFAVGPGLRRALREYRGRRIVLLVLYTPGASQARLAALAQAYDTLAALGVEVVAVPRDAAPDAIRRLGDHPRVYYPVVTEGATDITRAYDLFARLPHAEFLIDRQGYLRAVVAGGGTLPPIDALLTEVTQLNDEKPSAPIAAEHVH